MPSEVSQHRSHASSHRAAVMVKEARDTAPPRTAPLFPSMGLCPATDHDAELVVRYASFEEMLNAVKRPDPLATLQEKLDSLKAQPKRADESAQLPDSVWYYIVDFLGSTTRDMVRLSSCCRRLRVLAQKAAHASHAFATVSAVPQFVSLSALTDAATFDSVAAFLSAPGRAAQVQHFALVESKFASTVPWNHPHFPALRALSPVLSLVACFPQLTTLDVRGVVWDCQSGARLTLVLPDLYVVAPQLETLKMGRDVMALWVPRWWERLTHLKALVIASRREQPIPHNLLGTNPEDTDAASATATSPVWGATLPLLELSPDFIDLLSAETRRWSIKLWCPLSAESAQQLLFPASPHTSLAELTVNVAGPSAAALLANCTGHSRGASDPPESTGKKSKAKKSVVQEVDVAMFPTLTTLTVANCDALPGLAPRLFQRLCGPVAPNLVHINVCNTVCVPVPDKKPKKKPAAVEDALAVA